MGLRECHGAEGRLAQRLVISSNGFQEAGDEKNCFSNSLDHSAC